MALLVVIHVIDRRLGVYFNVVVLVVGAVDDDDD